MPLTTKVWKIHYQVPLNMRQFKRLPEEDIDKCLAFLDKLERLGASDVEYSGHFGSAIYFAIKFENQEEHDTAYKDIMQLISDTVRT